MPPEQIEQLSYVADELNRRGWRTRQGNAWGPEAVFHLLARLVDSGPRIFSSRDWPAQRRFKMYGT